MSALSEALLWSLKTGALVYAGYFVGVRAGDVGVLRVVGEILVCAAVCVAALLAVALVIVIAKP